MHKKLFSFYQNAVAEGMPAEANETAGQVADVVDELAVRHDLADALRQRAVIAHNTNEMHRLDDHLNGAQQKERRLYVNAEDQPQYAGAD